MAERGELNVFRFFCKRWMGLLFLPCLIISASLHYSKPADAKKTDKPCLYCHVEYGTKNLTEAGKHYKKNGTLDGFKEKK
jgi:hypothetical protein